MISGSVIFSSNGNASLPDSANSGLDGLGTRNPKSSPSLLNDARRMKCCVFVAACQTITMVWSALTTAWPERGAGQHASAGPTGPQINTRMHERISATGYRDFMAGLQWEK